MRADGALWELAEGLEGGLLPLLEGGPASASHVGLVGAQVFGLLRRSRRARRSGQVGCGVDDGECQADDEDAPEYQACSASVVSGLQKSRCTQWGRPWSLTAVGVESSTWCGPVHDVAGGTLVRTYEPAGGPGGSLGSGHAAWTWE